MLSWFSKFAPVTEHTMRCACARVSACVSAISRMTMKMTTSRWWNCSPSLAASSILLLQCTKNIEIDLIAAFHSVKMHIDTIFDTTRQCGDRAREKESARKYLVTVQWIFFRMIWFCCSFLVLFVRFLCNSFAKSHTVYCGTFFAIQILMHWIQRSAPRTIYAHRENFACRVRNNFFPPIVCLFFGKDKSSRQRNSERPSIRQDGRGRNEGRDQTNAVNWVW